jgi:CDGSH-type Zn-finger protein
MANPKITITKDGPYIVSGDVPLTEKIIKPKGHGYIYADGKTYPHGETYALCRCGQTKTPPFCDGSHTHVEFDGTETASRENYDDRLMSITKGPELDLYDDGRCALARFCHQKDGVAWDLVRHSDNPKLRKQAIQAAIECPAGRLVIKDKEGNEIEPDFEPAIEILQDPERQCSGPLYVKGCIPITSADGFTYEVRNRLTLCRCGKSYNIPFCDAQHIRRGFSDKNKR